MNLQARWCKKSERRRVTDLGEVIVTGYDRHGVILVVPQMSEKEAEIYNLRKIQELLVFDSCCIGMTIPHSFYVEIDQVMFP